MSHYDNLAQPPQNALHEIKFGSLKGKSDINPQWRYEVLTKEYGECGLGWKFEIVNTFTQPIQQTGELMVFVQLNFYTKNGDAWSAPIPGFGGDFLIKKDKNGMHGNDEAYKMAVTDALGTACKMVGVAANVYRGLSGAGAAYETKYGRREYAQQQAVSNAKATVGMDVAAALKGLQDKATQLGICNKVNAIAHYRYNVSKVMELDAAKIRELTANLQAFYQEMEHVDGNCQRQCG
jgi:hypothetical protein